jgi:hypothetical protein
VLDFERQGEGYRAIVEDAALHDYWTAQVADAGGGRPLLPFATLVPEIRTYFPTAADVAAFDEAPRE